MSIEQKPLDAVIREYFSAVGKKGGKRCLETMTPRARKARAKKAVKARWDKAKNEGGDHAA